MTILAAALAGLTALLAPFYLQHALVTIAALLGRRREAPPAGPTPRFAVVVPAHDEEGSVAATVASCLKLEDPGAGYAVVVVADNCSDRTAEVARAAGAQVLERFDDTNKSKGHALRHYFERPEADRPGGPFDAAVIVDADTLVDAHLLRSFAEELARGRDWLQCYYTVSNPSASWRTELLTVAFALANGVWPQGMDRLGLGATLKGNGMCFSRRGLDRVPFRAAGLVEDLEFSWTLRVAGERVAFVGGARVYGEMVSRGGEAAAGQRRRWEAGRRALRGRFLGPILGSPALGIWRKGMYAVELASPPLVELAAGLLAAALVHPLALWRLELAGWSRALAIPHGLMGLTLLAYGLSPLAAVGLPARYLGSLSHVPRYAAWKLAAAWGRAPREWVRTRREGAGPPR